MSSLYVYTTEGACIYPDGGSNDASINRYFESVNFVVDTRDQNSPSIEAYFRAVLPSGRPEQLFLRFQGEDPSTLFEDCRRAVREELVTANGWQIQQTDDTGDPSMVFQRAVLDPMAEPDRVFENTPLAGQQGLLRSAIRGTRSQFAVSGRNYQAIADAVRALDDTPAVMAVADGDISLSGVDLTFSRARQQYDLALPRESKQVLQQVTQQDPGEREQPATEELETQPRREAERIESELSTISDQLQSMRDADVSQSTVREQLDSVVSEVYPSLSVSSRRESALAGESRSTGEDSSAGNVGPMGSPEGRFSGLLPNVSNSVAIGAVAGAALVVLVLGGVVFGGGFGGNSGSGDAEFEVESLDVDDSVTAGEDLEIRVEVENVGDDAGDETVTVDAGVLGDDQLEFQDVPANDSKIETATFETAGQSGQHTVSTENYPASKTVEVLEPATFTIENVDIQDEENIVAGDEILVDTEIQNIGDEEGSQTVALSTGSNIGTDEVEVNLVAGNRTNETLSVPTDDDDHGEYNITIDIDDRETVEDVTVLEPASFDINIVGADEDNSIVTFTFSVENTGEVPGTAEIEFETSPDLGTNSTSMSLDADEERTIENFEIEIEDSETDVEEVVAKIDGEEKDREEVDD